MDGRKRGEGKRIYITGRKRRKEKEGYVEDRGERQKEKIEKRYRGRWREIQRE